MFLSTEMVQKLDNIKIVLFDLNGVLIKSNSLDDICKPDFEFCFGELVNYFKSRGIKIGVITANKEESVKKKLSKFDIEVGTSTINKLKLAEEILERNNLSFENLLYVGDEIFDLELMRRAGFSIAPATASRTIKRNADYVTDTTAGEELMNAVKNIFVAVDEVKNGKEQKI